MRQPAPDMHSPFVEQTPFGLARAGDAQTASRADPASGAGGDSRQATEKIQQNPLATQNLFSRPFQS